MKKFLSILLTVAMVLSMLCLPAVAGAGTITLTQDDFEPDANTGVVPAVAKIADNLGGTVILGEDVTVTVTANTQFPLLGESFYGTFDGNDKTITFDLATKSIATMPVAFKSGVTAVGVLFDSVGDKTSSKSAAFKNLTVEDVNATLSAGGGVSSGQFAVFAGTTKYTASFTNVHLNDVTLGLGTGLGSTNVAGFIAKPANTTEFINCSFAGNLSGGTVGGIVAATANSCHLTNIDINAVLNGTSRAGGAIGLVNATHTNTAGRVYNIRGVTVNGTVGKLTVTGPDAVSATTTVGGLIGEIASGKTAGTNQTQYNALVDGTVYHDISVVMNISEVVNNADVAAKAGGFAGGMIGRVAGSKSKTFTNPSNTKESKTYHVLLQPAISITDSINNGRIAADSDAANSLIGTSAGFIGNTYMLELKENVDYPYSIKIENSLNAANIGRKIYYTEAGRVYQGKGHHGGFIGRLQNDGTYDGDRKPVVILNNLTNTGSMTSNVFCGGIISTLEEAHKKVQITGCVNLGNITSARGGAGILGEIRNELTDELIIENCINAGDISQTATDSEVTFGVGSIVGELTSEGTFPSVTLRNCFNFGSVTKKDAATLVKVGKIYGNITADNFTVAGLYDFANVTASVENTVANTGVGATFLFDSAMLRVLDGARMRLSADVTDGGIRYDIQSNKKLLDKMEALGFEVTLGSKMSTAAAVESTNYKDLVASTVSVAYDENYLKADGTYSAAANKLPDYTTEYNCGGFITFTKNDVSFTVYTEAGDARSVKYIAEKALEDNEDDGDQVPKGFYDDYLVQLNTYAGIA